MMAKLLEYMGKHQDIVFVACIGAILVTIFVPIPTTIIDLMLVLSITISFVTLLTVIYIREPVQFSVFPSLLLLTTSYRLALNIATTRLILANAGKPGDEGGVLAAGYVIKTFGEFVAGNDAVIGFVIFGILIVVNFVVITKGSNRISEVAARFTLDAMPGKQMAIDADLNSGLIKEPDARKRREAIAKEADFYGAMDGATKFVRGDAVAGIIITLINLIGGFIIGITSYGMTWGDAMKTFSLLTIGDGLVSQIPALIISLSAGLIVTRATAEADLGKDFIGQMFSDWKVLAISAVFLGILSLTPLPTIPLLLTGTVIFMISRFIRKGAEESKRRESQTKEKETARKPEKVEGLLPIDPMEVEIGYALIRLVDPNQGGMLLERVTRIRRQMALDLGVVVPPIRIRDNMQLGANDYIVKIRGVEIARGNILPDHCMAMDSGVATGPIEGIKTKEPAFGMPALWITEPQRQRAEALGYTVVDATTVLATHLTEITKRHAAELLTRDDVSNLVKTLRETRPAVVEEVVDKVVKTGEIQKVLQNLLKEGVSIRDLGGILEALGDYAPKIKDPEVLTEYVRNTLSRTICQQNLEADGKMYVITIDPKLEDFLRSSIEKTDHASFLTLSPQSLGKIREKFAKQIERLMTAGHTPVVLCSPQVRLHVKKMVDGIQTGVNVLSYNEVLRDIKVESMGMVETGELI